MGSSIIGVVRWRVAGTIAVTGVVMPELYTSGVIVVVIRETQKAENEACPLMAFRTRPPQSLPSSNGDVR